MSKEAMENEEKRINNTLSEWKIEKFLYMRKEVLDKQKDLEKTNLEMVEKLKLSDEKFEKLSNELQSKMDKIVEALKPEASSDIDEKIRLSDERIEKVSNDLQSKIDRIIETLKPEKSSEVVEKIRSCDEKIEQMSKEHHEKMDSIQSKLNEIDNTLKRKVSSEIDKLSNDLQSKMDKIVEKLKPETISGIEQKIRLCDERIEKLLRNNEQHEKFVRLDMRKEFLDKQKDLEKSNLEMVEMIRLSDKKFEKLSKELQSKMDRIDETLKTEVSSEIVEKIRLSDEKIDKLSNDLQSKMDKIIETHKPEASSEVVEKIRLCDEKIENLSKEHREKLDSIQSKLIEIVETAKPEVPKIVDNNDPATSGKYFVLKHTFNNVSSFENNKQYNSDLEEHFGVPWKISVKRLDGFLQLYLCTDLLQDTEKKWKIEVEDEMKIVSPVSKGKEEKIKGKSVVFKSDDNDAGWGYRKFMEWDKLEKEFVVDDCFCAEVAVKVRKMTGIYKENLRSFDKTMEEYSDVVLIVNNEKFYVSKWILATHSPYFKNLFMEKSNETEKSEIQLSGIDEDDFQNYLEVLYGKEAIDEFTVEGILMVAGMYHTRGVNEKCENFLKNESKKTLKKKFQLSKRYNLPALMMSREAMENEEKRIKNTLSEWTVEKFLDMRKELLERQKDLEKSNLEMVEKLRLSDEKFEKLQEKLDKTVESLKSEASSEIVEKIRLSDDKVEKLSKKFDSIQWKLNQTNKTLKPIVSSEIKKLSMEHQEKFDSIQSKLNEIDKTLKPEVPKIVEKIRLCDENIEKLTKEHEEKMNSIQLKLNKIEKIRKREVSSEIDKLSHDLQSKMDKIVETLKPETISGIEQNIRLCDDKIEKLSKEQHEKFVRLDMRKEFLDRQKDLEKTNLEMVEKLRLSDERIEKLSKELQSKMDKIHETLKTEVSSEIVEKIRLSNEKIEKLSKNHQEKFDSIQSKLNKIVENLKPETISGIEQKIRLCDEKTEKLSNDLQSKMDKIIETHKPEASSEVVEKIRFCDEKIEKMSKEHQEKFDSIQWILDKNFETLKPEVSSEIEKNNDPATSGKYFVLKHTFNNISNFQNNRDYFSEEEEHFGVPWRIGVKRNNGFLSFYLKNLLLRNTDKKMEIEVEYELKIVSPSSGEKKEKRRDKSRHVFKNDGIHYAFGRREFMEWDELEKDFVVDDCFCVEIAVKVKKMTGIYKENLRKFDKTMEQYSDVVLIVNDQKFYVLKTYLATKSPYFKTLFMEKSNETEKTEITLSGIDSDDFQKYVEVLHGNQAIDEFTVEGILMVAVRYHTRLVIEKCENFLKNESKKPLKKKLQLSSRYNLAAFMKQCVEKIN
ncbi:hypothetical protein CRE_08531 [Caenorhabditis remanei]|uniref:BTB domain-containing protein n=1 Tax=Caenorhabditis remanei TaxID=31234 RepID=E3NB88_CAERE|nr:hypothetical protein CRE_08531 [Caenorhabditis remanei]